MGFNDCLPSDYDAWRTTPPVEEEQEAKPCPHCGGTAYEYIFQLDGEAIGCDCCVKAIDYWDYQE